MIENQIDRDVAALDSYSADESESADDDYEIADNDGLSRSLTTSKFDSYKVTIIENSLRLRFEKVYSYHQIDSIHQKSLLPKQETKQNMN